MNETLGRRRSADEDDLIPLVEWIRRARQHGTDSDVILWAACTRCARTVCRGRRRRLVDPDDVAVVTAAAVMELVRSEDTIPAVRLRDWIAGIARRVYSSMARHRERSR